MNTEPTLPTYELEVDATRATVHLAGVPMFSIPRCTIHKCDMPHHIFQTGYIIVHSGFEGINSYKATIRGKICDSVIKGLKGAQ